jgi:hypothetical protein
LPWLVSVAVHCRLDVPKQPWSVLHLVDDERASVALQQPEPIVLGCFRIGR